MKKWLFLVIVSAFIIAMTTMLEKELTQDYSPKTQVFYENYKSRQAK